MKSQLLLAHQKIKKMEAEKKKTIKMYRELKDKENFEVTMCVIVAIELSM